MEPHRIPRQLLFGWADKIRPEKYYGDNHARRLQRVILQNIADFEERDLFYSNGYDPNRPKGTPDNWHVVALDKAMGTRFQQHHRQYPDEKDDDEPPT